MSASEDRRFQYAVMLVDGTVLDEEKPFDNEADAMRALQRERQHLRGYGVGDEYMPILARREVVVTVSSWGVTND